MMVVHFMTVLHLLCSEMCKCGYSRNLHGTSVSDAEEWTLDNTITEPTDAFGEVQFAGSTMKARKVRISMSVLTAIFQVNLG